MIETKLNIEAIRKDFPILEQFVNGKKLVYFDNAATTQKPVQVIDTIVNFYKSQNSNIHRGIHFLSSLSTDLYEQARIKVQHFINAAENSEVVFTHGTTESINLMSYSFGHLLNEGDEVIISEMEHHANIVPWQVLRDSKNIKLKYIPFDADFQLDLEIFKQLLTEKTKLVSLTFVSNTLGTINPVKQIIKIAHSKNVPVLLDAAQAIQHLKVDVQDLDCDFLAFSGHKIYAETGIGVLYGKKHRLEQLPPYQTGGDMIEDVTFEKSTFAKSPFKFEAGTTNYAGAISLNAAIDYINSIGLKEIETYEKQLHTYAYQKMLQIPDIEIYATKKENKTSVISFNLKGLHNSDIGSLLDKMGIAVRTGGHCTHPLMKKLGIMGTVRPSFAFYNTFDEIDYFIESLNKVIKMLK